MQYDRGCAAPVIVVLARQSQTYPDARDQSIVEIAVVMPAPCVGIVGTGP